MRSIVDLALVYIFGNLETWEELMIHAIKISGW